MHCVGGFKPERSRRMVRKGLVCVNSETVRDVRRRLEVGDRVTWEAWQSASTDSQPAGRTTVTPRKMPRPAIFFRDEHIAVVFKPAGMLTVPTPRREKKTLLHWLTHELKTGRDRPEIRAVQRLDRDVSGVLVFARSQPAWIALRKQFEQHLPNRRYLALVAGHPVPEQGTFSSMMATTKDLRRYSVQSKGHGERAITHYRVLETVPAAALVEVWLETGKRHQIRVHFAEVNSPVLGDDRYKRHSASHPDWPEGRIALHAATLGFEHPVSGEPMEFRSDPPYEFREFLDLQKGNGVGRKSADPPKRPAPTTPETSRTSTTRAGQNPKPAARRPATKTPGKRPVKVRRRKK